MIWTPDIQGPIGYVVKIITEWVRLLRFVFNLENQRYLTKMKPRYILDVAGCFRYSTTHHFNLENDEKNEVVKASISLFKDSACTVLLNITYTTLPYI